MQGIATAPRLTALQESEREDELGEWLEDRGIPRRLGPRADLRRCRYDAGVSGEGRRRCPGRADRRDDALARVHAGDRATDRRGDRLGHPDHDSGRRGASSTRTWTASRSSAPTSTPGSRARVMMMSSKLKKQNIKVVKDFDHDLPPGAAVRRGDQPGVDQPDRQRDPGDERRRARLTLTTSRENDCVRVEIGDTGPGIPEELQQRIFEPFFTTKGVGEGTGLGLDISYRIVAARHGGDIRVESEPGDTRFIVRLPLTERPVDRARAPRRALPRIAGDRAARVASRNPAIRGASIRVVVARCTPHRRGIRRRTRV